MKRQFALMAVAIMSIIVAGTSAASADTLPPGRAGPTTWKAGEDPAGAFVLSDNTTGLVLLVGCDSLDGIYPHLALGAMSFVSSRDKERLLGFKSEPAGGVVLTVSGTTKAGPFSFNTEGAGPRQGAYGGAAIFDYQLINYVGGDITPAQLRLLMRADSITVSARGVEHQFSAHGSARAIGRLSCTADID